MKKNVVLLIGLIFLFTFSSCTKDKNKENHFSFDGKDYLINDVALVEEVFNEGETNELSVFQFLFSNINDGDTTTFAVAVADGSTNTLGDNYPSVAMESEATRAIYPFGLFFFSGVFFQDASYYLTGEGGSVDINVDNGNYSVNFNKISAGDYIDTNQDGNYEYNEKGTVSGSYEGIIHKTRQVVSPTKKGYIGNPSLDALIQRIH